MAHSKSQDVSIPVGGVSFLVKIQFCQNSTWQGTIQWLDEKKSKPFRSLLELIQLVNEAINQNTQASANSNLWVEKEDVS
jgi:hypothetical protein